MEKDAHSVTDSIPGSAPSDVIDAVPETIGAPSDVIDVEPEMIGAPSDVIDAVPETIGAPSMKAQETLDAPQPETPETPKKRNRADYLWPIGYVVYTMVFGPVIFIFLVLWIVGLQNRQDPDLILWMTEQDLIWLIITMSLIASSLVLLFGNIVRSFRVKGEDAPLHYVRSMLVVKYGMIPFFVLHTFLTPIVGFAFVLFIHEPDSFLFAIKYLFIAPLLFMLPGAFYGIRVVRVSLREKKLRLFTAILHGIALFIPVLDVLDAAYLSAIKWKTDRKVAVMVFVAAPIFLISVITLIYRLISSL